MDNTPHYNELVRLLREGHSEEALAYHKEHCKVIVDEARIILGLQNTQKEN